jgi:glucan phosphorylase
VQIRYPFDAERLRRMSLIEESPEKKVRMAHLAVVGSHSVNGVAELHTELPKRDVPPRLRDLLPRALQQQDQRGHAPALAPPLQSAALHADHLADR